MALDRLTKVDGGGISTTSDYRVGIITASKFVGPIEGDVTGSITATDGTFSGNVTIGGTLTYEDVTNIDSVGIITARDGIDCNGDIDVDGHTNLDNVSVAGVSTFSGNMKVDAGTNTTLTVEADSAGVAMFKASGGSGAQTTAALELVQSTTSLQGGGISYNGDGSPGFASGETADHVTFYRMLNGTRSEVFSYPYNTDTVTFNGTVIAPTFNGNLTGTINTAAQTNITSIGTLGSLTVNGGSSPISFSHTGGNCVTFNRNGKTLAINANYAGQNNYAHIALTSGMDIRLQLGGADRITFKSNGDIRPATDSQISLGSDALRFANLYVDEISASANISCVNLTPTGYIQIDDTSSGGYLYIGNNSDLKLFHNGSTNFIRSGADGHTIQIDNNSGVVGAKFVPAGAVELYHNGTKKYETTTNGNRLQGAQQDLHGDVKFDNQTNSGMDLRWDESLNRLHFEQNNIKAVFGASSELEIYYDGSANRIKGTTNKFLRFSTNNINRWNITNDGHLRPETDGSYAIGASNQRLSNLYTGYMSGVINVASTQAISEFRNQHSTYGGGVRFKSNNTYGTVEIMKYDGSYGAGFYNSTGGWHWDSNMQFHGNVLPWTNNAHDLGTSSKRWRNVYSQDLQLSNEARKDEGGNDVDGTWGDYTIQEGESDLFLINNRSGKKYMFVLKEVT